MTVGTTVSGTIFSGDSRRLSDSSTWTAPSLAASPEMLPGQFKRLRPESRASFFPSNSTPSARSAPPPLMPGALRPKAPPPMPQDEAPRPYVGQPPQPAPPASTRPIHDLPSYTRLYIPPQRILQAGTMARERRRKHINGYWSTVESGDGAELSRLFVPCETDSGILSVINEHASDAGSAKLASSCASVDLPATESRADGELPEPQLSETASDFSRETSPEGSNISATTVGELVRPDETAQDISEDEDTMSVVTDHTDLSLIEEFDASPTPFDPILLLVLISLKEEAVDHITRRLQTMMLQSAGTQRPVQDNNPGSSSSQPPSGDAGKSSLAATLTTGRKRALDEDEGGNPGRGDGDDGEKRKRIESTSKTRPEEPLKRFACPFYKRYPESEKLQKSCRGPGWPDVHRTK